MPRGIIVFLSHLTVNRIGSSITPTLSRDKDADGIAHRTRSHLPGMRTALRISALQFRPVSRCQSHNCVEWETKTKAQPLKAAPNLFDPVKLLRACIAHVFQVSHRQMSVL